MQTTTLSNYLISKDKQAVKEGAIKLLAEKLMIAAQLSAREVIDASKLYVSYIEVNKAMDEEKLMPIYIEMAEKLINKNKGRKF